VFRESDAPNAKIWVDPAGLARHWRTRFGPDGAPHAEDARLDALEELAEVLLQDLENVQRELADLRRERGRVAANRQSGNESRKK
jgi:hypothetical protein